jgi:hypothetical protein
MKTVSGLLLTVMVAGLIIVGCSKPEVWEMSQWYTQLSRYKDDEVRAFSIHIKVLDEEKIQKICDYYFDKFAEESRYLRLDFYDNRAFTPDYTKGLEATEAQVQHMVARYIYDPFTGSKRLEMLK